MGSPGPKTRQIPCQKAKTTFLKKSEIMKIDRNWTHIRRIGLRIKPFETRRCYESDGTPLEPQNCHPKFKIGQKSNGSHRGQCTLSYSVNRITPLPGYPLIGGSELQVGLAAFLETCDEI